MSISISTSDYKKVKQVEIDGVKFEVRPMNSSETLALMSVKDEISGIENADNSELALKSINKIEEIYFSLFDKPEKAKKVLGGLGMDAWFEIYNKIMEQGK